MFLMICTTSFATRQIHFTKITILLWEIWMNFQKFWSAGIHLTDFIRHGAISRGRFDIRMAQLTTMEQLPRPLGYGVKDRDLWTDYRTWHLLSFYRRHPKILSEVVTQKKLFKNDYQNMIENLIQHFSRWKNTKRPRYHTIVDLVGML